MKAELLAKVPEGLDLVDAAALPLVTLTGNQAVSVGADVKAGQSVLIAGAVGSVGRSAVFTAKELGAVVTAGVFKKQLDAARNIGADNVVALDDSDAVAQLAPLDAVVSAVRGQPAAALMAKIKKGGVFSSLMGTPDNASAFPDVRVVAFVSKQNAAMLEHMAQAVHEGQFVVAIERRTPLSVAAAGYLAVEKGEIGKMLLLP